MTKPDMPPFLTWVDCETSGLDPGYDEMFELGIVITDLNLEILHSASWIAGESVTVPDDLSTNEFVRKMHIGSGLYNELVKDNDNMWSQEKDILLWLNGCLSSDDNEFELKDGSLGPMCGSTVGFDRAMLSGVGMGKLVDKFGYRNIDVSTIKELAWRWNPRIMEEGLEKEVIPRKLHRVIPDLEDSIEELKFYQREFLLTNLL